jgi:hypothetical protein
MFCWGSVTLLLPPLGPSGALCGLSRGLLEPSLASLLGPSWPLLSLPLQALLGALWGPEAPIVREPPCDVRALGCLHRWNDRATIVLGAAHRGGSGARWGEGRHSGSVRGVLREVQGEASVRGDGCHPQERTERRVGDLSRVRHQGHADPRQGGRSGVLRTRQQLLGADEHAPRGHETVAGREVRHRRLCEHRLHRSGDISPEALQPTA